MLKTRRMKWRQDEKSHEIKRNFKSTQKKELNSSPFFFFYACRYQASPERRVLMPYDSPLSVLDSLSFDFLSAPAADENTSISTFYRGIKNVCREKKSFLLLFSFGNFHFAKGELFDGWKQQTPLIFQRWYVLCIDWWFFFSRFPLRFPSQPHSLALPVKFRHSHVMYRMMFLHPRYFSLVYKNTC